MGTHPTGELERHFGLLHTTALNVTAVVGAGVFISIPLCAVALAGWLYVYCSAEPQFIVLGLGTLAFGLLVFVAWTFQTKAWPFLDPRSQ